MRAAAPGPDAATVVAALGAVPCGIWVFDGDHRLVFVNAAAWARIGAAPSALPPGTPLRDVVRLWAYRGVYGPGDPEALARRMLALDRARPQRRLLRHADGTVYELHIVPLPDGGFCSVTFDVSCHLAATEEAAARARRLEAVLAHLRAGAALYDPERRLVLCNPGYEDLLGLPRGAARPGQTEDALLRLLAERGEFATTADPEATLAERATLDPSRPRVFTHERPNGTVLRFESRPAAEGGHFVEITDITALKRAEDAAQRRAALLDGVLAALPYGVAVFDPDRRVTMANAAWRAMLADGLAPGAGPPPPRRLHRQRGPEGAVLDIRTAPLPGGGHVEVATDITALLRAEAQASERAALLQLMLESMRHGIALYGPDRRLRLANALARDLAGLTAEEMVPGRSMEELLRLQQARGLLGEGDAGAATAEALIGFDRRRAFRFTRALPDGRIVEIASDPTPDDGFVVTWTDVTRRARAEEEARNRAALLQVMLDNIRHGICYFGPDRRVIAANALAAELGGHPPGSLLPGRSLEELVAQQLAQGAFGGDAQATAAMMLGLDRRRPHRYVRPNADGRILEVTSDPTPDGGFVVTTSDITPLVQAEAEARRRASLQQAMLDNIRHGICLVDAEGRVAAANPVYRRLLNLPETLVAEGRPYAELVDWLEAQGHYGPGEEGAAVAAELRSRDRRQSWRHVRTLPDGTVLEVVSDPTPDGGFVLTLTDVTEDRRIRAELERAKEAAEAASRAKSRFLATMSHELRTPLNAIIGFSEALADGPDPTAGEYARAIHEAGRHLLSLIDDILDATRAETTGFEVAEDEVDVARLAAGALRVMGPAAAAGRVALGAELPPDLPGLRADERRLRQVLLNLLSNAVKFTPPGGAVTLSAAVEEGDGGLVIRVADTGIGMRPEDIPRAFEPFTQLDSSFSRRFPGSGLGLYLARSLTAAQGGELSLESRPGEGTTAVLRFPRERLLPTPVAA